MFAIDPYDTRAGIKITIAGLKTSIYQYQAFGVYWQMVTSRTLGGGFVADDMGLGKTLSFLSYIVVERQLCERWRDVNTSRNPNEKNEKVRKRHLQIEEAEQNPTAACPLGQMPGWITCPCTRTSPTYLIGPQPGLRMACVPPQLVKKQPVFSETDKDKLT